MTQKVIQGGMLAVGLVLGGIGMVAHYAAADSTTTSSATNSVAVIGTSKEQAVEENDASEKAAEEAMTPVERAANEAAELVGDHRDSADMNEEQDGGEMNDAAESALTPQQKAAHDAEEAAHESGGESNDAND